MHVTLICTDDDNWAIGMRSISSALKQAGHSTRIILTCSGHGVLNARGLENIRSLSRPSDIVGISSMSRSSRKAKALIEALKSLGKPIVWGGMHPTVCPEDCVGYADLICRGEGEEFMVELTELLSKGKDYLNIQNGGNKKNDQVILNDVRPVVADMDSLPFVDFSFSDEFNVDERGKV